MVGTPTYQVVGSQRMPRQTPDIQSASSAQPSDTRSTILEVATRLFAERGYGGTSLDAIASKVGIRKASLLYHFSSKASLREAVLESILTPWSEIVPRLMRMATSGPERLESAVGEAIAFFQADPARARVLARELLDRPQDMQTLLDAEMRPWIKMISAFIAQGQEEGSVHPDADPESYVMHIVLLIVCGVSAAPMMSRLLATDINPSTANDPDERTGHRPIHELIRLARAGLFIS